MFQYAVLLSPKAAHDLVIIISSSSDNHKANYIEFYESGKCTLNLLYVNKADNGESVRKQDWFLQCQTPTLTIRLNVE